MVEHSPVDVSGSANPKEVLVAHPFETTQSSELPGKHNPSGRLRAEFVELAVFWNSVEEPDTSSAGNVASCSSDGGELEVDSDSHGLVLTSPDKLEKVITTFYQRLDLFFLRMRIERKLLVPVLL